MWRHCNAFSPARVAFLTAAGDGWPSWAASSTWWSSPPSTDASHSSTLVGSTCSPPLPRPPVGLSHCIACSPQSRVTDGKYLLAKRQDFCIPVKLPLIFPGARLKINGVPGNIQGNLTDKILDLTRRHVKISTLLWKLTRRLGCHVGRLSNLSAIDISYA